MLHRSTPESGLRHRADGPRARSYDLIAFDWDGTLFDSTAIIARCIQDAVRDVGGAVPSDEAASHVIGLGLMDALAHADVDRFSAYRLFATGVVEFEVVVRTVKCLGLTAHHLALGLE